MAITVDSMFVYPNHEDIRVYLCSSTQTLNALGGVNVAGAGSRDLIILRAMSGASGEPGNIITTANGVNFYSW